MRVLITNATMSQIGGTQTWVRTMAAEYKRRGHDVDIYAFDGGVRPEISYDLMLINHNVCLGALCGTQGTKVFTSHGPHHPLEQPVWGADRYVAVSEEVVESSKRFNPEIIRNPIDLEKFTPDDEGAYVADVLVMCKNWKASKQAQRACYDAGLSFSVAHYQESPVTDVCAAINRTFRKDSVVQRRIAP